MVLRELKTAHRGIWNSRSCGGCTSKSLQRFRSLRAMVLDSVTRLQPTSSQDLLEPFYHSLGCASVVAAPTCFSLNATSENGSTDEWE